jgi:putative tryptophan/tyrosine transport system substrate-binding protein
MLRHVEDVAPRVGVTVRSFDVRTAEDFDGVFREIVGDRLDSLLVIGGPVNVVYRHRIVNFAATHRMPAISISRDYVDAGGLMSYGPSLAENMRYAAKYVARILKGVHPGNLPVEQPAAFEFVVNKKAASSLGLTISYAVLARADQVIE